MKSSPPSGYTRPSPKYNRQHVNVKMDVSCVRRTLPERTATVLLAEYCKQFFINGNAFNNLQGN
jgi:hypothetical protein